MSAEKLSYSKQIKETLLESIPKKKCCKRIQDDVFSLKDIADAESRALRITGLNSHFKCASCATKALSALFIIYGNVTNPEKQYHLEFSFESEAERDSAKEILEASSFEMKCSTRKNRYLLYIKDSSKIEDFFALIGANKAAFDFINTKIINEVRGDANRQMNCDMANISKSIAAAEQIIELITEMDNKGYIPRLPKDLQETATLRIVNTQASMAELGSMHTPQISKSGVKHRLDKIKDHYYKFKSEE